ncbi:MAG TPA: DUF2141 domain-containing protein [Desulfobacterales bacterium]|nr:DUF2141 domain-containing protein [Desulfobacterales bacterium]
MVKKAMLFLGVLLIASVFAYAEDKFTVSGEVTIQYDYDGDIYICLLTMEELRVFIISGHELSESPCKIIQMNTDLKKAGKVSFRFDNIPKGTYCVFTYWDVNMNGEVDRIGYDFNEPWGSYKEDISRVPHWGIIKFDLEKNITGITIKM